MDESRVNRFKEYVNKCADIERNVAPIINTCVDGMTKAADLINPQAVSLINVQLSNSSVRYDLPLDGLSYSWD